MRGKYVFYKPVRAARDNPCFQPFSSLIYIFTINNTIAQAQMKIKVPALRSVAEGRRMVWLNPIGERQEGVTLSGLIRPEVVTARVWHPIPAVFGHMPSMSQIISFRDFLPITLIRPAQVISGEHVSFCNMDINFRS